METAKPIAQAHDLEVIPKSGLLEIDYGDWQGKSLKRLKRRKLWKTIQDEPSLAQFPGGETFIEAQSRIVNEIKALCKAHKTKDVITCVSHSDMIKLAAAYYVNLPLDQFQRLVVQPGSLTTLMISSRSIKLINMNVIPDPHI